MNEEMTLEDAIMQVLTEAHKKIEPPATWNPLHTIDVKNQVNPLFDWQYTYRDVFDALQDLRDRDKIKGRVRASGMWAWSLM